MEKEWETYSSTFNIPLAAANAFSSWSENPITCRPSGKPFDFSMGREKEGVPKTEEGTA